RQRTRPAKARHGLTNAAHKPAHVEARKVLRQAHGIERCEQLRAIMFDSCRANDKLAIGQPRKDAIACRSTGTAHIATRCKCRLTAPAATRCSRPCPCRSGKQAIDLS